MPVFRVTPQTPYDPKTDPTYPGLLGPRAMQAYMHWKEFRPKMVKELYRQGKLRETLEEAAEAVSDEIAEVHGKIISDLNKSGKMPTDPWEREKTFVTTHLEVKNQAIRRYLLLPPEDETVE